MADPLFTPDQLAAIRAIVREELAALRDAGVAIWADDAPLVISALPMPLILTGSRIVLDAPEIITTSPITVAAEADRSDPPRTA